MSLTWRWLVIGSLLVLLCALTLAWSVTQLGLLDPHRLDVLLFGCGLLSLNLIVVPLLYWWDKRVAVRGVGLRIPEAALHSFAFLGGAFGALLSQRLLRHKTRKAGFAVVTWVALAVNLGWLWLGLSYLRIL